MKFIVIFLLFFSTVSQALTIPTGLSKGDREDLIRILGISTSSKLLTNPYPLGGYSGFEVGFSAETINTTDVSDLGDTNDSDDSFTLTRVTLGKGLYNDFDIYLHFSPLGHQEEVSEYGALARWAFYKSKFLPLSVSGVVHVNQINFSDSFSSQTIGGELLVGVNVNNFSLYFGGGRLTSNAEFMSHNPAVTPNAGSDTVVDGTDADRNEQNLVKQSLKTNHTFVGASFHYLDAFLALQIDRYEEPVYSAKLGLRF